MFALYVRDMFVYALCSRFVNKRNMRDPSAPQRVVEKENSVTHQNVSKGRHQEHTRAYLWRAERLYIQMWLSLRFQDHTSRTCDVVKVRCAEYSLFIWLSLRFQDHHTLDSVIGREPCSVLEYESLDQKVSSIALSIFRWCVAIDAIRGRLYSHCVCEYTIRANFTRLMRMQSVFVELCLELRCHDLRWVYTRLYSIQVLHANPSTPLLSIVCAMRRPNDDEMIPPYRRSTSIVGFCVWGCASLFAS